MFGFRDAGTGAGGPGRMLSRVGRGGAGAAAALFGVRVTRTTVLRVSGLLALRSLLASIQLPFDDSIASTAWSMAFSTAQTAVLLAIAADKLRWGGALGRWGSSIFTPADAPFVALYGIVVLSFGPILALAEAAVIVFEIMRFTRKLEDRMQAPQERSFWQGLILTLSFFAFSSSAALVLRLPVEEVSNEALGISAFTLLAALGAPDGNILHAALLTLYTTVVLVLGLSENIDVTRAALRPQLHSPECRAAQLVVSAVFTLFSIARAPHFVRTILYSAETVESDRTMRAPLAGVSKGAVSTLAVIAITFRFLVYNNDVLPGEYFPLFCRGLQVGTAIILYCMFLWIEARSNDAQHCASANEVVSNSVPYNPWQTDSIAETDHQHVR
jgi:hypothetical protein